MVSFLAGVEPGGRVLGGVRSGEANVCGVVR